MTGRIWESPELPRRLARELATPPLVEWRRAFAPELSYGRHAGPARGDARAAAVAIAICWDGAEWALPLTVRCARLTHHAGQVSLPGGGIDPGETPRETAERELQEELCVRPRIKWLGELAPLFVFASNSVVTPCVGVIDHWPEWGVCEAEVECVVKLPLRRLMDAESAPPLQIERGALHFFAPQMIAEGRSIWGATAVILAELRGRLVRCQ